MPGRLGLDADDGRQAGGQARRRRARRQHLRNRVLRARASEREPRGRDRGDEETEHRDQPRTTFPRRGRRGYRRRRRNPNPEPDRAVGHRGRKLPRSVAGWRVRRTAPRRSGAAAAAVSAAVAGAVAAPTGASRRGRRHEERAHTAARRPERTHGSLARGTYLRHVPQPLWAAAAARQSAVSIVTKRVPVRPGSSRAKTQRCASTGVASVRHRRARDAHRDLADTRHRRRSHDRHVVRLALSDDGDTCANEWPGAYRMRPPPTTVRSRLTERAGAPHSIRIGALVRSNTTGQAATTLIVERDGHDREHDDPPPVLADAPGPHAFRRGSRRRAAPPAPRPPARVRPNVIAWRAAAGCRAAAARPGAACPASLSATPTRRRPPPPWKSKSRSNRAWPAHGSRDPPAAERRRARPAGSVTRAVLALSCLAARRSGGTSTTRPGRDTYSSDTPRRRSGDA